MNRFILAVCAAFALASGVALAKGPMAGHPNLEAAHNQVKQAIAKISAAQKANEFGDDVAFDAKGNLIRVSKNGGGWGWGSQLDYFPEKGESVIVLCNRTGAIATLASNIHDAVAGE